MIDIKNMSVGYGKRDVLCNISTSFEKGMLTSIIGVNGSGKSTLLKAVLGIIQPSSGEIYLDGEAASAMSRKETALKAAYLAQGKSSSAMTVGQLVLHGRFPHLSYPRRYTEKDRIIAAKAMEKMGVDKYSRRPLGVLSGGMRQNAYIAMALAQDTDYILLDEPTTYLDISHQLELMKNLKELAGEGKGIIAVMHDLPLAMTLSDRIVFINNGGIIADGKPEHICRLNVIQDVFGVQLVHTDNGYSYKYGL